MVYYLILLLFNILSICIIVIRTRSTKMTTKKQKAKLITSITKEQYLKEFDDCLIGFEPYFRSKERLAMLRRYVINCYHDRHMFLDTLESFSKYNLVDGDYDLINLEFNNNPEKYGQIFEQLFYFGNNNLLHFYIKYFQ